MSVPDASRMRSGHVLHGTIAIVTLELSCTVAVAELGIKGPLEYLQV